MSLDVDVRHRVGEFDLAARFTVPRGLTVLFGPSGAGKSLTLRLVAGLERPVVGGRIALDGRALTDVAAGTHYPPQRRRIGMVFQQPLLLPHRSVAANVALAVRDGDRHARREQALAWLGRAGAAELAERRPAQLSAGQQQRVALARALAGRPRLLLLDEPFNALDVPVRRALRRQVRELVDAEALPAVFVTHDPGEVADVADRVVFADHGSIERAEPRAAALRALGGEAWGDARGGAWGDARGEAAGRSP